MADSERRDRSLFESERSFRLLVEGVADYALYMLDPGGEVTSWNIGGQRIKGYQPGEIIGKHFSQFYTPADQANGKPARALRIARETGRYEEEGWRVRKDGTFFWASVVIDAIHENGVLVAFAKITRDITERREAQQHLDQMQRKLAESQKLDALGQLTGGVAHDFNNLLMILSGNVHTLKQFAGDNPRALRALDAMQVATQRGAALTSQLLTFARRQSVNPQSISINEQISALRDVLDAGTGSAVSVVVNIGDNIWPVMVDVTEFGTALVNLAVNARDAMPEGGTLEIAAENVHLDEEDGFSGDFVAISARDTGVGIPDDIISKVFDPFFTTKAIGRGTGLGLSQVHGFAHQAGGTVRIESTLGQGTKVIICLPRGEQTRPGTGDENETSPGGMVLVVEDNRDVAQASSGLLEQLGFTVCLASNAEEALQQIDRDHIDLVFSDIVMPGKMDGIGLAEEIQRSHPGLPILLTTGYSGEARLERSKFPVLRKPYQIHDLSKALSKLKA